MRENPEKMMRKSCLYGFYSDFARMHPIWM